MAKWLHKMKQISLKYRLTVLALIVIGLFLIALSTFCFGRKAEGEKGAGSGGSGGRLIPISQLQIPVELAEKVEIKSQAFLKFFKAPTQQFIPLGFYAMPYDIRKPEKLRAFRKRGINLFHKYRSTQSIDDALADLQAARKAGVGVLQNLPRAFLVIRSLQFWRNHISALSGNEQILVWYLPEETVLADLSRLEQIANIIRATDVEKRPMITYVAESDSGYLKRVGSIADAVVFGAYPGLYGPRPRADIKRRIEKAYESGVPVVIAGLGVLKLKGENNWTRPKDVRFDAYLSLISGAKGVMWFSYYQARQRPKLLEAVLEVATEFNGPEHLGEVFLLGKEPRSLICKLVKGPTYSPYASAYENKNTNISKRYNSIQWSAREYGKYLYIFAVNTAQEVGAADDGGKACTVEVEFGPVSSVSSEVHVISEERTVDLSGGYFVDSFEPLGTHIYKVKID